MKRSFMKKTRVAGFGIGCAAAAALGILFGDPVGAGALATKPYRGEIRGRFAAETRAKLADGGCLAKTDSIELDVTYITLPAKEPAADRVVTTTVSIPANDPKSALGFASFSSITDSAGRARISIRVADALESAEKSINPRWRLTPGRRRSIVSFVPTGELIYTINVRPAGGLPLRICG
jgi:hypothetical protein